MEKEGRYDTNGIRRFSNALAKTPRYYIMADRLYRCMELMDTARIQLKHTGSKCLADFKTQSEYALPLGRKTIQQSA
jgi:hypothetical protein